MPHDLGQPKVGTNTPLRLIDIQGLPRSQVCLLGQPFGSQEQLVVLKRNSAESLPDFLRDGSSLS
jgi:hypothetical protein